MIKNILFDLDDTLFDYQKAELTALGNTLRKVGVDITQELLQSYHRINIPLWQAYERKELSCEFIVVERFRKLFELYNLQLDPETAENIYENELANSPQLIDGAKEMLETLNGKFKLFVVSNGLTTVQDRRLKLSGIEKYFDNIFTSQKVGVSKPDTEFFQFCFRHIKDFKKEETIIVGDSLTSDIKGGKNSGITTIWFNRHNFKNETEIKPDLEFSTIDEVKNYFLKDYTALNTL